MKISDFPNAVIKENVDYTEAIDTLESALERQYEYLDIVLADEKENLDDLTEKMISLV